MKQKRVLSVQDISCFGKCSGTVALPILSAADLETVIVPTALLSTHTGEFEGYTFLDLTGEMEKIFAHYKALGLHFDTLYTGYFGSAEQLSLVDAYRESLLTEDSFVLVDPVMGDRGKLYSIYDDRFAAAMGDFCRGADLITPNVTEACLLSGVPYRGDAYEPGYITAILDGIAALHCGTALITGVLFGEEQIGVVGRDYRTTDRPFTLAAPRSDAPLHGTGDVFASALLAYRMNGFSLRESAAHAIRLVSEAIRETEDCLADHWYGLKFEGCLGTLTDGIRQKKLTALLQSIAEEETE